MDVKENLKRATLATLNRSIEDRDMDKVTIVDESVRSSASRRRRLETNLRVEIDGRTSSINQYVVSPETAEREINFRTLLDQQGGATVFKYNHPRNKCYVFFKDKGKRNRELLAQSLKSISGTQKRMMKITGNLD